MRQPFHPRVRIAAIATAVVSLLPLSAFAQAEHPAPAPSLTAAVAAQAAQAAEAPAGPVRRISIDDAVKLALEQNLGIQIQRMDPQVQDLSIAQAKSFWAPSVSSTITKNNQTQAVTSALSGGETNASILIHSFRAASASARRCRGAALHRELEQRPPDLDEHLQQLQPAAQLDVESPVSAAAARNLSMDSIRQQVALSKKSRDLSDINLEAVVTLTRATSEMRIGISPTRSTT